jgi:hypothetical protein
MLTASLRATFDLLALWRTSYECIATNAAPRFPAGLDFAEAKP